MGSTTDWKYPASCPRCAARTFDHHNLRTEAGFLEFLKAGFERDQILVGKPTLVYRNQLSRELHQPDMITEMRTRNGKARLLVMTHATPEG